MRICYLDNQGVKTISHWFLMAMKQFIIFLLDITVNFIPIRSHLSLLEITLHLNSKWILLKYSYVYYIVFILFYFLLTHFRYDGVCTCHVSIYSFGLTVLPDLFLWLARLVSSWLHERSEGHSFFCPWLSCHHPTECIAFCLFTHSST